MAHIYAIRNDYNNHKELDLETMDIARSAPDNIELDDILDFSLVNKSMSSWWVTPETKFIDVEDFPECSIPDVSVWAAGACLILSPKAYRILGELMMSSGEFLPVAVGNATYQIFNCLTIGEADESKSKFRYANDKKLGLEYLEFKKSASELLIFKSKVESCLTLFCSDQLKEAVESFELSGLIFDTNLIEVF